METQIFKSGAIRGKQKGKPRYDLISPYFLERLAIHLMRGAEKYGERNWEKGIPVSRHYASLLRHLMAFSMGKQDEEHLAAAACNLMFIIHTKTQLPEFDDMKEGEKNG